MAYGGGAAASQLRRTMRLESCAAEIPPARLQGRVFTTAERANPVLPLVFPLLAEAGKAMRQMRVLVVEDETINREIMAEALIDAGFSVDAADSADEALRLLDADGYQLLVTDIHMPGRMDGIGLAHEAHSSHPRMPIVFVTGRPDVLSRLRGSGIRGSSLAKPFGLSELVRMVSGLIKQQEEGAN